MNHIIIFFCILIIAICAIVVLRRKNEDILPSSTQSSSTQQHSKENYDDLPDLIPIMPYTGFIESKDKPYCGKIMDNIPVNPGLHNPPQTIKLYPNIESLPNPDRSLYYHYF